MSRPARVAVIYYSATGNVHRLAHALAEGAEAEGAEVRLRHVEEFASEMLISQNQYWGAHARSSSVATGSSSTSARCLPQYWFWEMTSSDASSSTWRRRTSAPSSPAPSASACASWCTLPVAL